MTAFMIRHMLDDRNLSSRTVLQEESAYVK